MTWHTSSLGERTDPACWARGVRATWHAGPAGGCCKRDKSPVPRVTYGQLHANRERFAAHRLQWHGQTHLRRWTLFHDRSNTNRSLIIQASIYGDESAVCPNSCSPQSGFATSSCSTRRQVASCIPHQLGLVPPGLRFTETATTQPCGAITGMADPCTGLMRTQGRRRRHGTVSCTVSAAGGASVTDPMHHRVLEPQVLGKVC